MATFSQRWTRAALGCALLASAAALLPACSDSPSDVVEALGEHAQKRRIVQFRASFSTPAQTALRRQFREDGLNEAEGWRDLMMGYLGRDREPPEVLEEQITGEDSATVKVSKTLKPPRGSDKPAQTIVQELALSKEDDEWRLALGPMVYSVETEKGEEKEEEEKPLAEEPESFELGEGKDKPEKMEDINLEDF